MQAEQSLIPSLLVVNQDEGDTNDWPLDASAAMYRQPDERWHTRRENVELDALEQMQEENGRLKTENEQLRVDNEFLQELRGNLETDNFENSFRVYILRHWSTEKIKSFALHLLGDEAQTQVAQLGAARVEFDAVYARMPQFAKNWLDPLKRLLENE